jgi:hypothetical protein
MLFYSKYGKKGKKNTIMVQRKVKIPKGSWLDQKGQRWVKVFFDVMFGFGGVKSSSARLVWISPVTSILN